MKEFKYFIDTNVFLRTLLKDDEKKFKDCVEFLNEVKKGKIKAYTSNLILAEINWTLLRFYKFSKEEVIKGLKSILNLKNLKIINNSNSILAIEIYKNHSVKFIDALIASNPKIIKKEIAIVSYDKDFDKIKVKRLEPGRII